MTGTHPITQWQDSNRPRTGLFQGPLGQSSPSFPALEVVHEWRPQAPAGHANGSHAQTLHEWGGLCAQLPLLRPASGRLKGRCWAVALGVGDPWLKPLSHHNLNGVGYSFPQGPHEKPGLSWRVKAPGHAPRQLWKLGRKWKPPRWDGQGQPRGRGGPGVGRNAQVSGKGSH